MKIRIFILLGFLVLICTGNECFAQKNRDEPPVSGTALSNVSDRVQCKVQPFYKYRDDGQAGREVLLTFPEGEFSGKVEILVIYEGDKERSSQVLDHHADSISILLPFGAGVENRCLVSMTVKSDSKIVRKSVLIPPKRQWEVYIYPHSHVDIGYTAHQDIVQKLHMRNIDVGIDIAKKTQHYPQGARFVWNPEALWVVDSYLEKAGPEKRAEFIEAVKKGWICLDGNYLNTNTSANSDEELLKLFHYSNQMEDLTGVAIETMVQFDIPGASWGLIQAAVQNGIESIFMFPNHGARIGRIREYWEQRPFYWVAPDDSTHILFLQGYPYGYGFNIKGCKIGQKIIQSYNNEYDRLSTEDPLENFIDPFIFNELERLETMNHPYDMYIMTWALCDNSLIDADLPEAVKMWNEIYAFPRLIIAGAKEISNAFESKYHNRIPVIRGDYTEYWTDGLGSDAKRVGWNRLAKERLVQVEALNVMLDNKHAPVLNKADDSWKWIMLGTEHTWGYMDPASELAIPIEATKASYFEKADQTSRALLDSVLKPIRKEGSERFAAFNSLSWSRSEVLRIPAMGNNTGNRVVDEQGQAVPSQRLSTGELAFLASDIPAFSSKTFQVIPGKPEALAECKVSRTTLENEKIKVLINPETGDIKSLFDKQTRHEYVNQNSAYALNSYRYLLGADSADKAFAPTDVKITIKENGPLLVSLLIESNAKGCNWLQREIQLGAGQSWINITNTIDKISTRTKEGIHFGFAFDIPGATTRMDIPWGVMIPEYDQIPGSNKNWLSFQRWIDVSNADCGITWTSIYSPLVEFGDLTANILGVALDVNQWMTKIDDSQTLFSWALNNHWFTNFPLEQGGPIRFQYQILTHSGYDAVTANRFGLERNRPLILAPVERNPVQHPLVTIDNPKVAVSMLKKSEDGKAIILRLRSVSDQQEMVQLDWPGNKPKRIRACNAEEKPGEALTGRLLLRPYGVVSCYIEL
ncbi:MAG: glycosyl hydrolase [Bacteroidetes bacterium]|nr:glycosyl hydrolase [Bacteroidota bacterium]